MRFTKMQGIGNDYVYVNGFSQTVHDPVALAKKISNRHFGVGSDGLILILPSTKADVRMRMFNADGSESEMCGNGIRCVAKFAYEHNLARKNPLTVETGSGVLTLELHLENNSVDRVTVNMGQPILQAAKIPVHLPNIKPNDRVVQVPLFPLPTELDYLRRPLRIENFSAVSMGNPHLIFFCDAQNVPLEKFGPYFETHPAFPHRINVHFVHVLNKHELLMRTWERGSGITLACGTGACAVAVAAVLTGRTDRRVLAHLPGGDLDLHWQPTDDAVMMTGPAVEVFSGDWPV